MLATDPGWELGDAFADWCDEHGHDPEVATIDDYLEWCADQDPRIGEDEYR